MALENHLFLKAPFVNYFTNGIQSLTCNKMLKVTQPPFVVCTQRYEKNVWLGFSTKSQDCPPSNQACESH